LQSIPYGDLLADHCHPQVPEPAEDHEGQNGENDLFAASGTGDAAHTLIP
jgi:hypothetical protein